MEKYLIQLSSRYPNIHEKQFSYTWTVEVGRDHYYTQIVRDLIDKVGLGFYKKNEFLPSEAQLAKQYKVSISTIKKSLSVLNELGYGETINGKGTKIYIQNDQYTIKSLNNKKYRKDTIIYLNALQLMVLNIEVAAFLAFEEIDARTISNLKTKIQNSQNIILDELFHCILEHVQLKPLKTVLQENNKVLYWGYYLSFYYDESQIIQELNSKAMVAFEYLSSGNQKDFAKEMSKCYRDVFHIVKKHMISFGLYEVKRLIAPR
ncbi:MAG: winged helix-turn-helix domain-containing protein [Coprobacillus cateniformis]|uniref:winged helix-turn-helix domain-containing protein n=1 Tax=Coprobacillus cateniformis TaxID=100884 RepID=UPI0002D43EDA|nr:GntR family transcriptional regulator [Coprobacillus cateniformis]MBS5597443.1 GntR family transcriptional regulator [Coprobacillus cateniformis]